MSQVKNKSSNELKNREIFKKFFCLYVSTLSKQTSKTRSTPSGEDETLRLLFEGKGFLGVECHKVDNIPLRSSIQT